MCYRKYIIYTHTHTHTTGMVQTFVQSPKSIKGSEYTVANPDRAPHHPLIFHQYSSVMDDITSSHTWSDMLGSGSRMINGSGVASGIAAGS